MADETVPPSPQDWMKKQGQPQTAPAVPSPEEWQKKQQATPPSPEEWAAKAKAQPAVTSAPVTADDFMSVRIAKAAIGLATPKPEDYNNPLVVGSGGLVSPAMVAAGRNLIVDPLLKFGRLAGVASSGNEGMSRLVRPGDPILDGDMTRPATQAEADEINQKYEADVAPYAMMATGNAPVTTKATTTLGKIAAGAPRAAITGATFTPNDPTTGAILGVAAGTVHSASAAPEASPTAEQTDLMARGRHPVTGMPIAPEPPKPGTFEANAQRFIEKRDVSPSGTAARAGYQKPAPESIPDVQTEQLPPEEAHAKEAVRLQGELDAAKQKLPGSGDAAAIQERLDEHNAIPPEQYTGVRDIDGKPILAGNAPPVQSEMYHVTATENVPSIQEKGITALNPSNWQTGTGERYGNGDIFAFDNLRDAHRWAAKMDWDFNRGTGTGKISIVRFNPGDGKWEVDTSDPLSQLGNQGQWQRMTGSVAPENITGADPFTQEQARALAQENRQASTGGSPPGEPPIATPPPSEPPPPPPPGEPSQPPPESKGPLNPSTLDQIVTKEQDPAARALLEAQVERMQKEGKIPDKEIVPFIQQRLNALGLDTSPEALATKEGHLTYTENLRASLEYNDVLQRSVDLGNKMDRGEGDAAENQAEFDRLNKRLEELDPLLLKKEAAGSEFGRALGSLRNRAALTTDPAYWVQKARTKAAKEGGTLSVKDATEIRRLANEAGEATKKEQASAAVKEQTKRTVKAKSEAAGLKQDLSKVKDEIEAMRGEGPNTYTVLDKEEAAGLRPEKEPTEAEPVKTEDQGLDKSKDTAQGLTERDFALARMRNKALAIQARLDALLKDRTVFDPEVIADNRSFRAEQIKTAADAQRAEPLTPGTAPKAPVNPIDQLSRWVDDQEAQLDKQMSKVNEPKAPSLADQLSKESAALLRAKLAKKTAEVGPSSLGRRVYDLWQTGLLTAAAPRAAVAHALSASVDFVSYPAHVGLDVTQSAVRASVDQLRQAATEGAEGTSWGDKYWQNRTTNFSPIEAAKARARGSVAGFKQGVQIMKSGTSVDRFGKSSLQGTGFGRTEISYDEPEVSGVLGPMRTAVATPFNSVAQAYSRTVHRVMQFAPHVIMGQEFEAKIAELARVQAKAEGSVGEEYQTRVKNLIENPLPSMQTEAAGYAAHLGLIDQSRYARGMTAIQRMIPGGKVVIPFPTVEGNIVGRAVESSPLALFNDYGSVRTLFNKSIEGAPKADAMKSVLQNAARASTSTAIIAAGYMLAKNARMTRPAGISLKPGEAATDKLTGQAPGELATFGVKGPDRWYALDASGPYGILMQVGAEMYYSSLERDASVVSSTGKSAGVFTRAVLESSAFTGMSTLADAARDPENFGDRYLRTLAGSVVPSIVGRTAMAIDPIDRFVGKPGSAADIPDYVMRSMQARMPFATRALPAQVSAFGGEQTHDTSILTSLGFRSTADQGATNPTIKAIEAAHYIIPNVVKQARGESDEAFQARQVLYGKMAEKVLTQVAANTQFQDMPNIASRLIKEHPEWGAVNPALLSDAMQRQIMHDELGKIESQLSQGLTPKMPKALGGMVPKIAPDSATVSRLLHNQSQPDSTEP